MIIGDLNAEDSKESKYQEEFQNILEKGKILLITVHIKQKMDIT